MKHEQMQQIEIYAKKHTKPQLIEQAEKMEIKNPGKYYKLELAALILHYRGTQADRTDA